MMAQTNTLLVEGKDDDAVIFRLFNHYGIVKGNITIVKAGGDSRLINDLIDGLRVRIKNAEPHDKIGVVIDADTDVMARWTSLRNTLIDSGYQSIRANPDAEGTVIAATDKLPTVGIWLMPDNRLSGMLEDFVSFLIPHDDKLWGQALQSVANIPVKDRKFAPQHQRKAEIHTWLAWQKKPGKPLGLAIMFHYLDANADHAKQFIAWVRRLFDLQSSSQPQPQLSDPTSHP